MRLTTLELAPREDERGRNRGAQQRYLARVSGSQGDTPDEVLLDWFQEQPAAAETWAFLDLASFTWCRANITRDRLPAGEVCRGGTEQLNRLSQHVHWERQWIWKSVQAESTWHLPPILLRSAAIQNAPDWLKTPLHLAEGYHRLAAVHRAMSENLPVAEAHTFWIASHRSVTEDADAT